jgi:transposase
MASAEKATRPITSPLVPDLEAVRVFITEMVTKGALLTLIEAILGLLARMRDLNTELVQQLAHGRRARPPSERSSALQGELPFAKILPANDDNGPPAKSDDEKKKRKKKRGPDPDKKHRHGRGTFPEWMERVLDRQLVPEGERTCPDCGVEGKTLRFKHCEKLTVRPVQFVVERSERETISCPQCHEWLRTASRGDEVLDRGKLGNELLVQACVDHFDHAIPWDRMASVAREQGVPLSANTLARSVGRLIDLFEPIVTHITAKVLSSQYVSFDATSFRVLDDKHPRGIRTGALWSIAGDHRYALFFAAPSGHADLLKERLKGYRLSLAMCDGSATNNVIEAEDGCGAIRGGCWAHARRKLVAALRNGDERAIVAIEIIGAIFHVEAESKRAGECVEQRLARRRRECAPLMERLRAWCEARRADVEPMCLLGIAIGYLRNQWVRLSRFLEYAAMDLTNNETERDLRRHVLNRKTWFFVGHDDNARRNAEALTLLTTCHKMGIDPRAYLRDTLRRLLAGEKDLTVMLPESYAARVAAAAAAAAAALAATNTATAAAA